MGLDVSVFDRQGNEVFEVELLLSFEFDACDRDKESISEFAETLRLACRAAVQHDTGIQF